MGITAAYSYDPGEHYRATRAVTRFTSMRWVVRGAVLLGVGMAAWVVYRGRNDGDPVASLVAAAPYVLLALFWAGFPPYFQRRAARKLPERDPSIRGEQERRVDAAGYHAAGNGVHLDIPWHAMARGVEEPEFFLFFYNMQCAYYLPKRVLSAADCAEVRRFMRAGLGAQAQLIGG